MFKRKTLVLQVFHISNFEMIEDNSKIKKFHSLKEMCQADTVRDDYFCEMQGQNLGFQCV
jgi:hypothetical protein